MTTSETSAPVGPDGTAYGTPTDRPVTIDDCTRFDAFLSAVDALVLLIDADQAATAQRLADPLNEHYGLFDYILATAQPAVWADALTVINWLYAVGAGNAVDQASAQQSLAAIRSWHDANCNATTPP